MTDTDMITVSQALQSRNKNEWISAMHEELNSLKENNTFIIVPAPHESCILTTK
jgi:hypothetical protein